MVCASIVGSRALKSYGFGGPRRVRVHHRRQGRRGGALQENSTFDG
jgi:hypothetical protein